MPKEETSLTTPVVTTMARPDFLPATSPGMVGEGKEAIGKDDIQIPRLALAQGLTPQVAEQKEGFGVGVLFNSVTEKIYGRGPLKFVVLRADRPKFILFRPREEGGGIIKYVQPDDPDFKELTDFGPKGEKPAATKFYEYIVAMLPLDFENPMNSVISLSLKSSGLKTAKRLNSLMKFREGALYEAVYELNTGSEKNAKGIYAVYKVENAGWVPDKPTYEACKAMFNSLKDKQLIIDRDVDNVDDVDDTMANNPEQPSGEAATADM